MALTRVITLIALLTFPALLESAKPKCKNVIEPPSKEFITLTGNNSLNGKYVFVEFSHGIIIECPNVTYLGFSSYLGNKPGFIVENNTILIRHAKYRSSGAYFCYKHNDTVATPAYFVTVFRFIHCGFERNETRFTFYLAMEMVGDSSDRLWISVRGDPNILSEQLMYRNQTIIKYNNTNIIDIPSRSYKYVIIGVDIPTIENITKIWFVLNTDHSRTEYVVYDNETAPMLPEIKHYYYAEALSKNLCLITYCKSSSIRQNHPCPIRQMLYDNVTQV